MDCKICYKQTFEDINSPQIIVFHKAVKGYLIPWSPNHFVTHNILNAICHHHHLSPSCHSWQMASTNYSTNDDLGPLASTFPTFSSLSSLNLRFGLPLVVLLAHLLVFIRVCLQLWFFYSDNAVPDCILPCDSYYFPFHSPLSYSHLIFLVECNYEWG